MGWTMNTPIELMANFLKALAYTTRLKITRFLSGGSKTQGEISEEINRSQSTTSSHIEKLVSNGIVLVDEKSHPNRYSVHPAVQAFLSEVADFVFTRYKEESSVQLLSTVAMELLDPSTSLQKIATIVLEYAKNLTNSGQGYVGIIDPGNQDLVSLTLTAMMDRCKMRSGDKKMRFSPRKDGMYPSLWGHSLNTRQSFFTNEPSTHDAAIGLPSGHIPVESFLSVPVEYAGKLVGQISLANSYSGYSEMDLNIIEKIATLYGAAILPRIDQVLSISPLGSRLVA
ncbi:GAF domain-containing protein [Candidatus Bathyarchaeota archaeon]|nr:GAF domain-containing protein [Candidatus Bathyarchaeota archaeon]